MASCQSLTTVHTPEMRCRPRFYTPLLCLLIGLLAPAQAEELFSTGDMSWKVSSEGMISTKDWPLVSVMDLLIQHTKDEVKKAVPKAEETALPELRFGSDRSVTLLAMDADKKNMTQTIQRSVRFDQARRAIRILDIITSVTDHPQSLHVSYQTHWEPSIVPKLASPRLLANPQTPKTPFAALITPPDPKKPVMMLLLGAESKDWKRKITQDQDHLTLTYSGTLKAKNRLLLLHWLTFADDVKASTVKKVVESLSPNGLPADDSLSEEVIKELVNYPIPLQATERPETTSSAALAFVDALAAEVPIKREQEVDQLVLAAGSVMKGEFKASKLKIGTKGVIRDLTLTEIAAIQGGLNARVFLRDGTVIKGSLNWESAVFEGDTVGQISIKPETLDRLVLRTNPADGKIDFQPVAWSAEEADGQIEAWKSFPQESLSVTWSGGDLKLPWQDITGLQRLPPPSLEHLTVLKDGSRILVWVEQQAAAVARTPEALFAMLSGKAVETKVEAPALTLSDGSILVGTMNESSLRWITKDGELQIQTNSIKSISKQSGDAAYDLETKTDSTLSGRPADVSLLWNRAGQTIPVPWRLIRELKPAPTP